MITRCQIHTPTARVAHAARQGCLVILALAASACMSTTEPTQGAEPEPAPAAQARSSDARPQDLSARVVAVGDLHGDLDNALATLRLAGVVDAQGHWSAGSATLVQTGDVTDRGPDSRALIDLMRRLQTESQAAGGQVVALLGNHEVMNLTGDWRYVHPGDIDAFGGVEARKAALGPSGEYGKWLLARPVAASVGDVVFVHGGIRASVAERGLDAINQGVHASLRGQASDATRQALLGSEGPLWFRGYVSGPEPAACAELGKALESLGKTRMVVGHTTRRDGRIQSRCDGRLQVIDVGIADAYGGNLAAWVLDGDDARAVYADGPKDLEDPS